VAWALGSAACSPSQPTSIVDPTYGLAIRLEHGSASEHETSLKLLGLLARHDLRPWLITRTIAIDEDAIPHSHPVLTLSTRHRRDDGLLLSNLVHEQLHWFVNGEPDAMNAALAELEALYPRPPLDPPEGAGTRFSTYLHLVIAWLEFDAVRRLVGAFEAERIAVFGSRDHYKWVHRTFLADRETIGALLVRHGLRPPG
jgi:hypothetical protein